MAESHRRRLLLAGALMTACAVGVAAAWHFRKAKVTGDTPEQRIASLIKIADDKPRGYAEELADVARNDSDAEVRRTALACLSGNGTPDARSAAMAATRDDDPEVRKSACISLMSCDDGAAAERLAEICREDTDEGVLDAAFVALAANESPYATVALMTMLEQGETSELRRAAAEAIIDKLNMSVAQMPEGGKDWDKMVEAFKMGSIVKAAYDQTGTPLVHDEAAHDSIHADHDEKCHCEGAPGGLAPEIPESEE